MAEVYRASTTAPVNIAVVKYECPLPFLSIYANDEQLSPTKYESFFDFDIKPHHLTDTLNAFTDSLLIKLSVAQD